MIASVCEAPDGVFESEILPGFGCGRQPVRDRMSEKVQGSLRTGMKQSKMVIHRQNDCPHQKSAITFINTPNLNLVQKIITLLKNIQYATAKYSKQEA